MKLKLSLLLFCLLGIGLFSHAQNKKKETGKPVVENGYDAIPVTVKSSKKAHPKVPPPPPMIARNGKPMPPPEPGIIKFTPPKIVKDVKKPIPPPPPVKPAKTKKVSPPVKPDAPPIDQRA